MQIFLIAHNHYHIPTESLKSLMVNEYSITSFHEDLMKNKKARNIT
jgi:hypothetical protein